ncbi:hypothetical protein N9Y26_00480 [bacterium]|nr:hypothetical protein [bacterium]
MRITAHGDEGSLATLQKLKNLENEYYASGLEFNYSGAGYLFDILGNDLTQQLIFGLLLAIFTIGLVFFLLNNFDFNYFIIAIVPNLTPIVVCVGLLYLNDFYFSLSNAFIFTIVFGLIIDDSIHVISAYTNSRKRQVSKSVLDFLCLMSSRCSNMASMAFGTYHKKLRGSRPLESTLLERCFDTPKDSSC